MNKKPDKQMDSQAQCPLCQSANGCAVNQGESISECWCSETAFPSKALLPKYLLSSNVCICRACIEKLKQEEQLGIKRID